MKKLIAIISILTLIVTLATTTAGASSQITLSRPPTPTARVNVNRRVRVTYRQVRNANRVQIQWRRLGTRNWRSRTIRHSTARRNTNRTWNTPALSRGNFYEIRVRGLRVRTVRGRRVTTRGRWSRVRNARISSSSRRLNARTFYNYAKSHGQSVGLIFHPDMNCIETGSWNAPQGLSSELSDAQMKANIRSQFDRLVREGVTHFGLYLERQPANNISPVSYRLYIIFGRA